MTDAQIAKLLRDYMTKQMAMPDFGSVQEQNWIYGHMHTFARKINSRVRRAERNRVLGEGPDKGP